MNYRVFNLIKLSYLPKAQYNEKVLVLFGKYKKDCISITFKMEENQLNLTGGCTMIYEDKYGNVMTPEEAEMLQPYEIDELGLHISEKLRSN